MDERLLHLVFQKRRLITGSCLTLASLILYTITMAPDIGAHDIAEWQATGITLGIAHDPGTPAYTIISHLFSLVPFGLPAARVTFLSVVMGAAGVAGAYVFSLLVFDRLLPAFIAGTTLAVATMWWAHASIATPYNAMVTIMTFLMILLFLWRRTASPRYLYLSAALAGAGLAYHPLLMFFLPVPVAGVFIMGSWRKLNLKAAILILSIFFLGLSIYLYLPVRSAMNPAVSYSQINSVSKFINYVSAAQARRGSLRPGFFPTTGEIQSRLNEVVVRSYPPFYIALTFAPLMLLLYPGVWRRMKEAIRWMILLIGGLAAQGILLFFFTDVYAHYYLPFLFYFAMWSGFAVYIVQAALAEYVRAGWLRRASLAGVAVLMLAVLAQGLPRAWDYSNHRDDRVLRKYVDLVFGLAKPNAVILATWETATGFNYVQKVEGRRPDITIIGGTEHDKKLLAYIRSRHPGAQVLESIAFNIRNAQDLRMYGGPFPLSHKALTWQDFDHGPPYPWSIHLFELRGDLSFVLR